MHTTHTHTHTHTYNTIAYIHTTDINNLHTKTNRTERNITGRTSINKIQYL